MLLATGCSKDNPFDGMSDEEGQVLKTALDVSRSGDNIQVNKIVTRAADADIDMFNVSFIPEGETVAAKSFIYGEMPDVVTLTKGTYTVLATYGEDRDAEWNNPYYVGESAPFEVVPNEITSYIDPVECELKNVKVTIAFDDALMAAMDKDAYVEVKVNNRSSLNYGRAEAEAEKAGYFKQEGETTLVATFHGEIDGSQVIETKSYTGINGGCWYKLTFRLHQGSGNAQGDADGSVTVDASVTAENVNANVTIEDDEPMDDGERPREDGDEPGPGPSPEKEAPVFTPLTAGMQFDTPYHVTASSQCKFKITSSAAGGFTAMTCDIISNDLTADELGSMGLVMPLDLVNTPEDIAGLLGGFGFETNVGGKKEVTFDLSGFMEIMSGFGAHSHEFKIHAEDANGSVTKSLILQF